MRVHRRGRQVLKLVSLLLAASLLGACSGAERRDDTAFFDKPASTAAAKDTGSCRPWFVSPDRDWGDGASKHSCWNLAWEIPAAIVAVPLALAIISAPIWAPILLLK